MSYQVLARKWRPQQFADLLGQEHVVKALTNALDNNRLHHAYLFTGMRGVGKTTIARIFAKSLNCEKGVSATPCGQCATCQDIENGRFFDLIEVDAASKTGVDATRELMENATYAPSSGRYKVFLIDEVHMFSNAAFNALLKTLEEPPEHTKFILATTEHHKIPVTVLSRCLQFSLKGMSQGKLAEYLGHILETESIQFDKEALAHIAYASEGSVRDSLSLIEQATAIGGGALNAGEVETMLGRMSPARVLDVLDAIAAGDGAKAMQTVAELAEYGPDYRQLLGEMISVLHHIAMAKTVPGAERFLSSFDVERIRHLINLTSHEEVQLYHQIAVHGRRDMEYSPDQREAFEMTLLRMLAFRPQSVVLLGSDPATGQAPAASTATQAAPNTPGQATTPQIPPHARESAAQSGATQSGITQSVNAQSVSAQSAGDNTLTPQSPGQPDISSVTPSPVALPVNLNGLTGPAALRAALEDPVSNCEPSSSAESAAAGAAAQAQIQAPTQVVGQTLDSSVQPPAAPSAITAPVAASATSINSSHSTDANAVASCTATPELTAEASAPKVPEQSEMPADMVWSQENWREIIGYLGLLGMPGQLAKNCSFVVLDDNELKLQTSGEFDNLIAQRSIDAIGAAVEKAISRKVAVTIDVGDNSGETPAQWEKRRELEKQQAAEISIESDPVVQILLEKVDGVVDPNSVRPIDLES